ncbi:hypothetical protein HPP92_009773 [Vanilla planifolia]|uniref:DUF3741 domain-containing protein n=1 Tax=Vanilla planifolia TaxID=51239 RepID=A0A835RC53_VANPL|nr:hypothetical protein HPP92_009773 [Vanilla planifolia]
MDCRESSELQLLEVSRRVRELTQMIDSWSKAPKLDAQSKYVAKDLLRGSLNLQESLITIRRLQEASRMMSLMEQGFRKEGQDEEENSYQGFGSQRFRTSLYDDIFRTLSTKGSSWNHVNEIKSAISGKLKGQILESNFSNDLNVSGSSSYVFPARDNFLITRNSKGLIVPTTRAKTSNLVAKLMGLEEIPSQVHMKKEQKKGPGVNMAMRTLDNENSKILYCFTERTSSPVCHSEVPQIMLLNSAHSSYERKVERQKKKDILLAKLSQRKEASEGCEMLNMKKEFMGIDGASVEPSQRFRKSAFATHEKRKKRPEPVSVKQGSCSNYKVLQERKGMKIASGPPSQVNRARESLYKPKDNIVAAKARVQTICMQSGGSQKHITSTSRKFIPKSSSSSPREIKKEEYLVKTSNATKDVTTNPKGILQRSKPPNSVSCFPNNFSIVPVHGISSQLQADDPKHCCRENTRLKPKGFCEVMPKQSKAEKSSMSLDTNLPSYEKETAAGKQAESEKGTKLMLLSSRMFLTTAQKLFGFDVMAHQARSSTNRHDELRIGNACELLFACSREFMARKSYQLDIMAHPMWRSYQWRWKALKSMEELLENISIWMRELNGYHIVSQVEDGLYFRLERDLLCKDMPGSASWDIGWLNWVCVEDFEAVVDQVEKQIMYALVGEIAKDLVH